MSRYVQYSDVATCQDDSILLNCAENSVDMYQQETVKNVYLVLHPYTLVRSVCQGLLMAPRNMVNKVRTLSTVRISRKYEVEHALQYFTQSAAIWWKMHYAIQGFSGAESWEKFKKTLLKSRLI